MKEEVKEIQSNAWQKTFACFLAVFSVVFVYAIVRYNVLKGVPYENLPLYISNKAIAVTSIVLIGISYLMGPEARFFPKFFVPRLYLRKYFGLFGFGLAGMHGIISLLLFNPSYYPKFFSDGKLSLNGELSMLFGVLALFIFAVVAITSLPGIEERMPYQKWKSVQRLGYLAMLMILLHLVFMGFKGWLAPGEWPGRMLPLSLISFIVISFVILIRIIVAFLPEKKY